MHKGGLLDAFKDDGGAFFRVQDGMGGAQFLFVIFETLRLDLALRQEAMAQSMEPARDSAEMKLNQFSIECA